MPISGSPIPADPFRVRLFAGEELGASHPRSYEKYQVIEDWRHYVPLLLKKSFAVPWASALRHGDLPATFEAARLELVAQRADGNREFARLLELCLTHEVAAVEATLAQVRPQGGWSVDAVRQRLNFASAPQSTPVPLDPSLYPAYQGMSTPPDLSAYNLLTSGASMNEQLSTEVVTMYLKQLRLARMARECEAVAREAAQRGLGYVGFLQALLEGELQSRHEQQLRQLFLAAAFPYQKRLEDFDFSLVPGLSKTRLLQLAQAAFLSAHDNVLLIGPSGIGKTHVLMGLGRALCLAGYRVLFRSAVTLATELEVAHKELRLPRLLTQYRRFDLVLVDELSYLPFAKQTAELLFQFFSDRYERASVAITSNLAFAHWTQVIGLEQMTVALLDRLVHRSHVLLMEGESFRFRQSLQQQDAQS